MLLIRIENHEHSIETLVQGFLFVPDFKYFPKTILEFSALSYPKNVKTALFTSNFGREFISTVSLKFYITPLSKIATVELGSSRRPPV